MLVLKIQIYSNIRIILTQIFIRTFIRIRFFETNKFGYSFVQKHLYEYIRIFVCVKKIMRIYSDIHLSQKFETTLFGYSFESKFWRMSHSVSKWILISSQRSLSNPAFESFERDRLSQCWQIFGLRFHSNPTASNFTLIIIRYLAGNAYFQIMFLRLCDLVLVEKKL